MNGVVLQQVVGALTVKVFTRGGLSFLTLDLGPSLYKL